MTLEEPKRYGVKTLAQLKETASSFGCELVSATDQELLLDLDFIDVEDDPDAIRHAFKAWRNAPRQVATLSLIGEKFGLEREVYWRSRGGHLHVLVRLGMSMTISELIALQAALGSDPKREILAVFERQVNTMRPVNGRIEDTRSLFRPVGS